MLYPAYISDQVYYSEAMMKEFNSKGLARLPEGSPLEYEPENEQGVAPSVVPT